MIKGCSEDESEPTTIKLDYFISSPTLTQFYRTLANYKSQILDQSQFHQLFNSPCLEKPFRPNPQLLYRATRDGFHDRDFHKCCDDQFGVIILIKTKENDLFGGYTTKNLRCDEEGSDVKDDQLFTFQFSSNQLHVFRLSPKFEHKLTRYPSDYLFSISYSFWICSNANKCHLSSTASSVQSYLLPSCRLKGKKLKKKEKNGGKAKQRKRCVIQYFGGLYFLVEEIEVYKVSTD